MNDWTLYHNPKCSKSRGALELLRENGIEPRIVEYLVSPPTPDEILALCRRLALRPKDLARAKEPEFATVQVDWENDDAAAAALEAHPGLLERPIVVRGERAVMARPPEKALSLL